VSKVIQGEGEYVCNPTDPAGETKHGISKRVFPNEDIPNLTVEQARSRRSAYHLELRLMALAFESVVNQGLGRDWAGALVNRRQRFAVFGWRVVPAAVLESATSLAVAIFASAHVDMRSLSQAQNVIIFHK
jgi:hypothetical protein